MKYDLSRVVGFVLIAGVMVASLVGCGGSDTPPNANPTGYYDVTGTASVDNGMGTLTITDLQAMVNGNRYIYFDCIINSNIFRTSWWAARWNPG